MSAISRSRVSRNGASGTPIDGASGRRVGSSGDLARTATHRRTTVKIKLFSVQTNNRKPSFDKLESEVNAWLADHPNVVIEHTNDVTRPSVSWSHLALAVWYSEK